MEICADLKALAGILPEVGSAPASDAERHRKSRARARDRQKDNPLTSDKIEHLNDELKQYDWSQEYRVGNQILKPKTGLKFLLLSDIHNEVGAVKQLRQQELNSFDAIVVAGDIGCDKAQEIFDILGTFDCPVLYIYGNWDSELAYDTSFGKNCHHLHLNSFQCGPIAFVGISGCPMAWGNNPIAMTLNQSIIDSHEIVAILKQAEEERERLKLEADRAYKVAISELETEAEKKNRSPSRTKLEALERKFDNLKNSFDTPIKKIEASKEYKVFTKALKEADKKILGMNRLALAQITRNSSTPMSRTVVVTHERLYKTEMDLGDAPVFLYGHKHKFSDTMFRGARYINVSPMDHSVLNPEAPVCNYVIMEWSIVDGLAINRVKLLYNKYNDKSSKFFMKNYKKFKMSKWRRFRLRFVFRVARIMRVPVDIHQSYFLSE